MGGFDFEAMRLPQDYAAAAGVRREVLDVPARRPPKQSWFMVRPGEEWRYDALLLKHEESRNEYFVAPNLVLDLEGEIRAVRLHLCVTRSGDPYLWPIKLPQADRDLDSWNAKAHLVAEDKAGSWIRVVANMAAGTYDCRVAPLDEVPTWPEMSMIELLELAFPDDRRITSLDHPVVRQLMGKE